MASQAQLGTSSVEIVAAGGLQVVQRFQEELNDLIGRLQHVPELAHVEDQLIALRDIAIPIAETLGSIEKNLEAYKAEQEGIKVAHDQEGQQLAAWRDSLDAKWKTYDSNVKKFGEDQKRFIDSRDAANAEMAAKDQQLQSKDTELAELRTCLAAKERECENRERRTDDRDRRIDDQEKRLQEREKRMDDQEKRLQEREKRMDDQEKRVQEREERLVERETRVHERENRMIQIQSESKQKIEDCLRTSHGLVASIGAGLEDDVAAIRNDFKDVDEKSRKAMADAKSILNEANVAKAEAQRILDNATEKAKGFSGIHQLTKDNLVAAKEAEKSCRELKEQIAHESAALKRAVDDYLEKNAAFVEKSSQITADFKQRESHLQGKEEGFLKLAENAKDLTSAVAESRDLADDIIIRLGRLKINPEEFDTAWRDIAEAANELDLQGRTTIEEIKEQSGKQGQTMTKEGQAIMTEVKHYAKMVLDGMNKANKDLVSYSKNKTDTTMDTVKQKADIAIKEIQQAGKESIEKLREACFQDMDGLEEQVLRNTDKITNLVNDLRGASMGERPIHKLRKHTISSPEADIIPSPKRSKAVQGNFDDNMPDFGQSGVGDFDLDSSLDIANQRSGNEEGDRGGDSMDSNVHDPEDDADDEDEQQLAQGDADPADPTENGGVELQRSDSSASDSERPPTTKPAPSSTQAVMPKAASGKTSKRGNEKSVAKANEILEMVILPSIWTEENMSVLRDLLIRGMKGSSSSEPIGLMDRSARDPMVPSKNKWLRVRCLCCGLSRRAVKWQDNQGSDIAKPSDVQMRLPCFQCTKNKWPCLTVEFVDGVDETDSTTTNHEGKRWRLVGK